MFYWKILDGQKGYGGRNDSVKSLSSNRQKSCNMMSVYSTQHVCDANYKRAEFSLGLSGDGMHFKADKREDLYTQCTYKM